MKIDFDKYHDIYHSQSEDKFNDRFQSDTGIRLLPIVSNTRVLFDKKCGLQGMTGEFFRKLKRIEVKPIESFDDSVKEPVKDYLLDKHMPFRQVNGFLNILKDVLYINGNLNITESSFLEYLPLYQDEDPKTNERYGNGQRRMADYLYSMAKGEDFNCLKKNEVPNLFTTILKEALEKGKFDRKMADVNSSGQYHILDYIRKSFREDLKWLLQQEDMVIVKSFPLFAIFYLCYSVTQTIIALSPKKTERQGHPEGMYFILSSEKASMNCDAVVRGWMNKVPQASLDKLYGKIQTLDILNCCLGGHVGLYPEILEKLEETPFDDNKMECEHVLANYQTEKRTLLKNRPSESNKGGDLISISVSSYTEFLEKLNALCTNLQSASYSARPRKMILDLMSIRFLQSRRGNRVLVLDNEMLTFLIAMFTKGERTKLEDMYKKFNSYGIYFNIGTRTAIEELLLKLNLLERKSDSGEAQYVTVVL